MIYDVGNYCRLSKDDGTDNESASIATQKSILTDYVKKQGWNLVKTYVDDGYSGTNFQRPAFQEMLKDIENGLINCVITKDLSRLGRNYLDCGLYLEVFFPEHNVRYIAVNDGVDTLNKSAMDITPFRNILNEMYSADVSVKIKSAYRARFQQGKFMGTTAPYGYVKDPADHNHLLIDDKVAHVVREIFDLALAGNGISKIRKHINKQHILRPAAYAVTQGATGYERHFEDNEENRYIWSENSVRGILRSPIYAGNLAGYKRIAANMKSKKRPSKLPEEWEVIPDTHEGIVTQEEFDTVQQLITSRRLPENKGGFENIFAGVIKCADCGYAMRAMSANRRKRPDIIDCVQYSCNNYGRYGNIMCTAHSIEARDLFNAVLADINRFADMAVNDEKAVRAIEKRLTETDQSRAKALEKEQRKLNKRLAELDRLFSSLYEDKVMERITERNFEMMSGKYQKEQLEIEARLKEVTETLNDSYEKSQGVRDFLSLIRNYQGIKELDATIINALIDKILVSEREKLADGTVRQEIKIYYKFIGFVGELHITPTKRWTALKPKNCTVCGIEYVPRSAISKYCPECRKRIRKVQGTETKRRSRERNRQACIELSAKNDRLRMETEDRNNLKDYLPSDISNTSYEAKITNVSNEIVTEAQKTDASYSYNVSKNGNIGNQAEIEFTIHSNNYEDITFKVYITLTDRITVTPKEGTEPAIEGSNELYYGQTISELKLNTKKAKFVTPDGTEVSGILKFNTPDEMPEVGTKTVEYTFTPDEEQYKSYIGNIAINVTKQTPKLEGMRLDGSIYDSQKTFKEIAIDTGVASVMINGITYKVTKVVNTKNAQVMIKSLNKKKSSIVIPDYVTVKRVKCKVVSINKKALYKDTKLKKLTIGKNVQTIEDNAFNGCKNLKSITIKSTVLKKPMKLKK